jgi:Zn-finger nucleic acid-binding protein
MENQKAKVRINSVGFLEDFVRGLSDQDLERKYSLHEGQLPRLIKIFEEKGQIAAEQIAERKANLKVRCGSETGLPKTNGLAVDLGTGLVLHCPSCGAAVKRDTDDCDYCHAPLDFSLKGKMIPCPKCFADTPADARFCIRCGEPVFGRIKDGLVLEDRLCPKCELPMQGLSVGDFSLIGCKECGGAFVSHETFEMMQAQADKLIVPTQPAPKPIFAKPEAVRYVRCPVCRNMMNRTNFAKISGVIIDTCKGHGIWFDAGEVERIMDFILHGGIEKSKVVELENAKHEANLARIQAINVSSNKGEYRVGWGPGQDPLTGAHSLASLFRIVFGD